MQVETRDAHLPHTLWRNDYHIAGCEVDIVFEFGETTILQKEHIRTHIYELKF